MYQVKAVKKQGASMCLYQCTWLVAEPVELNELTICEGAVITAPEGKYVTLTVDSVGKQIKPGAYHGDVVLSLSDYYLMTPHGLMNANNISRYFRSALVVDDGKVASEKGVPAIICGGAVTDSKAENIYIASDEESFNGILIAGETEYTINNTKMDLDGFGDNDFLGVGAGVAAVGDAKVTINDSEINMSGVTRCAVHAGGDSVVTLNNCKLFNHSPDTEWLGNFSWQVGFCGSNRLTQLTDNATVYYNNCQCKTNGWGVLSIDGSDRGVKMYVKDSKLELTGPRAHGYGAFCIGDNEITFDHTEVDVTGYPMLVMGMGGLGRPSIINGCRIKGRRFGAMIVDDDNSIFTISDSVFETGKSSLVVKASATTVNIDNTAFRPGNGVILQLMDTDEAGMDVVEYKLPIGIADTVLPDRDLSAASETDDVILNVSNSEIQGDFFNSTTNLRYYRHVTRAPMDYYGSRFHATVIGPVGGDHFGDENGMSPVESRHNGDDLKGPKNMVLRFANTKVEGVISSASQKYKDGLTALTEHNRREASNITQAAAETVNNGVIVSLDKGSAWTVTGASYITALNISESSTVNAPVGRKLTMLVDGAEISIGPGSYKGRIALLIS